MQRRIPPPENFTKIIADVAIRDSYAVIAAVARNSAGQVIGAMVQKLDPVSPLEGEVETAKLGVKLACDQRFQQVILEGDSETVMKAIQSWPHPVDWRIDLAVKEIRDACCRLLSWRAVHVY